MLYNFLSLVIHFASNSSIVNEKVFIRSHLVCTRCIHISQILDLIKSGIFKCTSQNGEDSCLLHLPWTSLGSYIFCKLLMWTSSKISNPPLLPLSPPILYYWQPIIILANNRKYPWITSSLLWKKNDEKIS